MAEKAGLYTNQKLGEGSPWLEKFRLGARVRKAERNQDASVLFGILIGTTVSLHVLSAVLPPVPSIPISYSSLKLFSLPSFLLIQ